ncbi:uncharacterized protein ARMOST_07501 [Armillaria ostoyae]|uniref:Uncharacterized protein n=1 Tax=Armillaria ostoyae TaxID=47428 RepID=A0A284R5Z4_ARMOS|nr:uncharacterized protein ARMOST_07501 [Armillaria ostoyae]
MYKRTRGWATLSFGSSVDDALEIFFCLFQQLSDFDNHDNYKNPHLSSLIEIEDNWYGNMVILKTIRGDMVDLRPSPEEMRVISKMIKEFCLDYIAKWKINKSGADYASVDQEHLPTYLSIFR